MSGSFEDIHVPPTLVSFAVTTAETGQIASPEFKEAGDRLVLLAPEQDENGLPDPDSLKIIFAQVTKLLREKKAAAAWALGRGGIADAVFKMALGNRIGAEFDASVPAEDLFAPAWGSFLLEMTGTMQLGRELGRTVSDEALIRGNDRVSLTELQTFYEARLEPVYKLNDVPPAPETAVQPLPTPAAENLTKEPSPCQILHPNAAPAFLIPVFPGTNCEFDSARAVEKAGMKARVMVIRNRSAQEIAGSVEEFAEAMKEAQGIFIPGGFSGGDEPEGSAKFITAFFRNEAVKEGVMDLMDRRGGLILGICNGFQALIKLGLIHAGRILDAEEDFPTLTFNSIGRHQSRLVRTRVESVRSPWLSLMKPGDIVTVPISHGEGRFTAPDAMLEQLVRGDQIATRYVDDAGLPSRDIAFNPNGSLLAVEGLTSPDGRILGKMGHSERTGRHLDKNVPGEYDLKLFEAAMKYFKG